MDASVKFHELTIHLCSKTISFYAHLEVNSPGEEREMDDIDV